MPHHDRANKVSQVLAYADGARTEPCRRRHLMVVQEQIIRWGSDMWAYLPHRIYHRFPHGTAREYNTRPPVVSGCAPPPPVVSGCDPPPAPEPKKRGRPPGRKDGPRPPDAPKRGRPWPAREPPAENSAAVADVPQ